LGHYERLLFAVFALAGVVLSIACANVANLLLAKSAVRRREISVRLAIGAGEWRIVRQLLTEGLLLATIAGAVGLLFGYWARNGIPALLTTAWRPSPFDTTFDPTALAAALAITFFTGVLFSLAPAWQSRHVAVNEALKEGGGGTGNLSKLRAGRLLVVVQVALSVLLLAAAGLSLQTFMNLKGAAVGFRPDGLLLFTLDPPRVRYPEDRVPALFTDVQRRLNTLPGVESVTFAGGRPGAEIAVGSQPPQRPSSTAYAVASDIGARFFQTLAVPLQSGRAIDDRDDTNVPRVAVVNQAFARTFFQGRNPVGQVFTDSERVTYRIVGVCADWRIQRLRDPAPATFYSAFLQAPHVGPATFEVRIAGDEAGAVKQIHQSVRDIDPDLTVTDVRTAQQQIADDLSQERLLASLAAVFGGLALILAAIGIYGVMEYAVARRTHETGIRIALGALPRRVAWTIMRETLALAAAGVAIGVPVVLFLDPMFNHALAPAWRDSFAYGLRPDDPLILVTAGLVLAAVGVLAGYFPARRAARVDPMTALRQD
jgi:predicted permease